MTTFLRLLTDREKAAPLQSSCLAIRNGDVDNRTFFVQPGSFRSIPGAPFAYWVSEAVRHSFQRLPALEREDRVARVGLQTSDDFRFVRSWLETGDRATPGKWILFAKGGSFSPFYADIHLVVNWEASGAEIRDFFDYETGKLLSRPQNIEFFFRPGLTWPLRTNGLSFRAMPRGCVFGHKGPAVFVGEDAPIELLALCAVVNSRAFGLLVSVQLARVELAQSFEVGLIQQTPVPVININQQAGLASLARRAWSLKRALDTTEECSHAFALPAALRARLGDYDTTAIETELRNILAEIDAIAFDIYGFSDVDRAVVQASQRVKGDVEEQAAADDESDDEDAAAPVDHTDGLLSWAVGVAFGRFDLRLATGERAAPPEPEPFDLLPAKSPGMLPDGAAPFHAHAGILADDAGHPHDLARVMEEVLARVDASAPGDLRRWLQKDFFPFHLQCYSKSRRKAPIYWPLSTASGSYTLWVYYPSLTSQTLYTGINDFVEPKFKQVGDDVTALRNKGAARTREDEKQFEALQAFQLELIELRDSLLKLASTYKPNHDDGVQISAAPLWPLFRHKPWQKLLKDTWAKLEKGEYDWAQLAMIYWPDRVRGKCKTDKSLAIAHGLESLYVAPDAAPRKTRGKKKGAEE